MSKIFPSVSRWAFYGPLRVALAYVVFGTAWILITDRFLANARLQDEAMYWAAVLKGLLFVVVSAALVFAIAWREMRRVKHSTSLLQAVVEGSTDAIFVKDRSGAYLLCNSAAARFLGRSVEEMLGRTDAELFDAESSRFVRERDEAIMRSGMPETSNETLTAAGITRTYQAAKAPYRGPDGSVIGLVGVSRDVTKQVALEARLRDQEALLREVGELAKIGGWSFNPHTKQGKWTELTARFFEAQVDECDVERALGFIQTESRERLLAAMNAAVEKHLPYVLEMELNLPSGTKRWVRSIGRPEIVDGQVTLIRGSIQEITESKQLEEELRASEIRVRTLGDNLPEGGIFRYRRWPDGRRKFEFVSRGIEQLTEVSACEIQADGASLHAFAHPDDLPRLEAAEVESMTNLTVFDFVLRGRSRSGRERWIHCRSAPTRMPDDSTVWDGVMLDVTERRAADERLRQLSLAIEQCPASILITDPAGIIEYVNPAFSEVTGYSAEEVIGQNPRIIKSGVMPVEIYREMWQTIRAGQIWRGELVNRRKNGSLYWELLSISPLRDAHGRITHFIGVTEDITARKQFEESLRTAEERQRAILNNLFASVGLLDPQGIILWVNDAPLMAAGLRREDVIGRPFWDGGWWDSDEESRSRIRAAVERAAAGECSRFDDFSRGLNGARRMIDFQIGPIYNDAGEVHYLIPTAVDIDVRKRVEHNLRVRTELYAMLSRTNRAVSRCRSADELFRELCAIAVETGRFRFAWIGVAEGERVVPIATAGDDQGFLRDVLISLDESDPRSHGPTGRAFLTGQSYIVNDFGNSSDTVPCQQVARRVGFCASAAFPLMERGKVVAVLTLYASRAGFFSDELSDALKEIPPAVSFALDAFVIERERKRDEAELRLRDRALNATSQGIIITDPNQPDNPIQFVNSSFERLTGYSREEVLGRNCRFLQGKDTDPHAIEQLRQAIHEVRDCSVELLNYRRDGTPFWNALTVSPVVDAQGRLTNFVGVMTDVSERRRLEEQFRQAQKMEAIGQLTGGIAHDFNNLLTVINGYSDLLLGLTSKELPAHGMLGEIHTAGERAAALTRQLLAFSRKQILDPKILNLNSIVGDTEKMLRRMIGEDVMLTTRLDPGLSFIKADPGQIAQILINLAVNARDAMPEGGTLMIETSNVELDENAVRDMPGLVPGGYVLLAVTDTGCGMDETIKAHLFEPFFTTKGVGKGTGLGLATVHGIVQQSRGHILVESKPGHGTTMRIYFPIWSSASAPRADSSGAAEFARGTETILLVEDETTVRSLSRQVLHGCGYQVLEAADGIEALQRVAAYGQPIDLLVTDVVMPLMGGRELAQRILQQCPRCQVLFVSGYTDDAIIRHGVLKDEAAFLQKPYTPAALAQKVRSVLNGTR